jgi:hypothetical protein
VQVIVRDCEEALCCNSGKEDLAECTQISYPLRSKISWLYACRRLTERNKKKDIAPGWGEPRISHVVVVLCFMVVLFFIGLNA